jgi:lipoprotein-releasing system permease protein
MYKIILAIRYLFKRRISYFSTLATALCVFVVFVVITVISGLTAEFKRNTHLSVGDCVISTESLVGFGYYDEFIDILDKQQFVGAVSPVVRSYALVYGVTESGQRSVFRNDYPKEIMGVDPAAHGRVTGFTQWLNYNKTDVENVFRQSLSSALPGCVVGVGLLFERDSDGDYHLPAELPELKVEISSFPLTAKGALARAGAGEVNTKTFYLSDVAQSGVRGDWSRFYLLFEEAQKLCGMSDGQKRLNAIFVKFKPDVALKAGCESVNRLWNDFVRTKADKVDANLLRNVKIQDWKVYNRSMIAIAETQQALMIIVFGMIGIITVFIVFVVFYMIVSHKTKDIGILKSLGVSNGNILMLFLSFAFLVGVCGSAAGAVAGWRFLVHINQIEDLLFEHFGFQLFDRSIYAIGDIPNAIDLKVLGVIVFSAIIACLIGAYLPSRRAAGLKPVETLQVSQL